VQGVVRGRQHTDSRAERRGRCKNGMGFVGDAIFNIDFPRLGSSVVEHLVYNQGCID
jgi:hypothetical protein